MVNINMQNIQDAKLVEKKKKFSFLLFIVLLLLGFIPSFLYLVYYLTKDDDIFIYNVKMYDGFITRMEVYKNSPDLNILQTIEARAYFNNNL